MTTIQNNYGIELSVTVNGRPTRTYLHEGKYFIESRDGTEYAIKIKNTNWYRVEAVLAVDGLSVMDGKTASKIDSGYLINAQGEINIKGFRKDLNEVGAFKFTKKEQSYAAEKGGVSNVGIIALAVYKEKYNYPVYTAPTWTYTQPIPNWSGTPWYGTTTCNNTSTFLNATGTSDGGTIGTASNLGKARGSAGKTKSSKGPSGQSAGASSANYTSDVLRSMDTKYKSAMPDVQYSAQASSLVPDFVEAEHGTQWGKKIEDKVVHVTFERDTLIANMEIYYNSKDNLEAMGIKLITEKQIVLPKGFPGDFCEPPVGWTGK